MSRTRTGPPSPEPAARAAAPGAAGRSRRPRRRAHGRLARAAADARLAWAVALALALALAAVAVLAAPVVIEARDRERVGEVAALAATRLTTYDAGDLDRWVEGLRALSTETYAGEVARLVDEQVRADLAEAGVTSRGQSVEAFVQRLDVPEASAFAVVRQVTTSAAGDEPVATTVRMSLDLRLVGGDWRVHGIDVLAGGAPVPVPGGAGAGQP